MDYLQVDEVANGLGVDSSRVRQMLRSGVLAGRRFGREWAVPADAFIAVREHRAGPGRPLAPRRAWALLDLLDDGGAPWLDKVARSQVRAQLRNLAGRDADAWRSALRSRDERHPVKGHSSAIRRLGAAKGVHVAGPAAAASIGADLVVSDALPEVYVSADRWSELDRQLVLSPAEHPDAIIRIPRGVWPFGPNGPGQAALAASLLDSLEWRTSQAGAVILNRMATERSA